MFLLACLLTLTEIIQPAYTSVITSENDLLLISCARNPQQDKCAINIPSSIRQARHALNSPSSSNLELITPPPLPPDVKLKRREIESAKDYHSSKSSQKYRKLTPEEERILQEKCNRVSPLVQKHCVRGKVTASNAGRCAAYFRDCSRFIQKGDPLDAIANSFTSGVNINIATVDVKGIPYYPINEEGAVGVGVGLNIPFGAWGGGASTSVGVRDYWHSDQEAGANWIDGMYGYKNHWNVPLVQSLGIEGGQHNTVSFPLRGKDAMNLKVDNGYGVGGYYKHNHHVGVSYKSGDVKDTFGVSSPFVGAGFETGRAVSFPGLDVWERALG